jgi:methyl-accepting chemotaxis protein
MFGNKFKQALDEAQETLQRQKSILDAIDRSNARIEFQPDGKILDANTNFLALMGYSLSEVVGQHHRMFCEPSYVSSSEYSSFWQKINRGEYVSGRFKRINKAGKAVWLEATYNPVFDANQRLRSVVKFATDVTPSILAANDQNARLDAINRAMAIIDFDTDGNILFANDNFLSVVGYSLADVKGRHHRMFCDANFANSAEYQEFWRRLGRGEFVAGQFRRVGRNGNDIWLEASYNPVLDADGKPYKVVKFASDVTARILKIQQEATNADEALRISSENEKLSVTGSEVIQSAVRNMHSIAESAKSASAQIEELGQHSQQITSIVKTIRDIADQTNLLALNAAIEAARAGEAGRGFAVVADEVRKLAERTSTSTTEISDMINKVQNGTDNAVRSMASTLEEANQSLTLANQAAAAIDDIRSGAGRVVQVTQSLAAVLKADS